MEQVAKIAEQVKPEDAELTDEQLETLQTLIRTKGEVEVVKEAKPVVEANGDEGVAEATEPAAPVVEKKRGRPRGTAKAPKPPKQSKLSRVKAGLEVVVALKGPSTIAQLTEAIDKHYVAAGGKSNSRESYVVAKWSTMAGQMFGALTVDGDKVTPVTN
jgi:hypothetical protein